MYQSYKYDEIPPVKFFEKNGLTIILPRDKISYEPRYNVEAREQSLNEERQLLEADIGKNGDKIDKTREQTIPALQEQLKNLDKGIFTPDMVDTLKEAHNVTLPGVGPDLAQELANSPAIAADKEFLKLHIQ